MPGLLSRSDMINRGGVIDSGLQAIAEAMQTYQRSQDRNSERDWEIKKFQAGLQRQEKADKLERIRAIMELGVDPNGEDAFSSALTIAANNKAQREEMRRQALEEAGVNLAIRKESLTNAQQDNEWGPKERERKFLSDNFHLGLSGADLYPDALSTPSVGQMTKGASLIPTLSPDQRPEARVNRQGLEIFKKSGSSAEALRAIRDQKMQAEIERLTADANLKNIKSDSIENGGTGTSSSGSGKKGNLKIEKIDTGKTNELGQPIYKQMLMDPETGKLFPLDLPADPADAKDDPLVLPRTPLARKSAADVLKDIEAGSENKRTVNKPSPKSGFIKGANAFTGWNLGDSDGPSITATRTGTPEQQALFNTFREIMNDEKKPELPLDDWKLLVGSPEDRVQKLAKLWITDAPKAKQIHDTLQRNGLKVEGDAVNQEIRNLMSAPNAVRSNAAKVGGFNATH